MRTSPSRTCLGCRRARPKALLVRLVRLPTGTVVTDPTARAEGRGAYVCPDAACVDRALSPGRLRHAFRRPSEAGPNLAAVVRAAARPGAGPPACEASPGSAVVRAVSEVEVDVIAVRA